MTPALPLALFRIWVGILGVVYFILHLLQFSDISSQRGLLDHSLAYEQFWFARVSIFQLWSSDWLIVSFLIAALAASISILLGVYTRSCALFCYVVCSSLMRWNLPLSNVEDTITLLMFMWLLFLPTSFALTAPEFLRSPNKCLKQSLTVRTNSLATSCFLANIAIVYFIAGGWKFHSELWRSGDALQVILQTPIAWTPQYWKEFSPPVLRWANFLALFSEPLIGLLLLFPRYHRLKWVGLFLQLGFHLTIAMTMRVPLANLAMFGSSVLFFRHEINDFLSKRMAAGTQTHTQRIPMATDRIAIPLVLIIALSVSRHVPVINSMSLPASALLWTFGLAQEYRLFDWIDIMNYEIDYKAETQDSTGHTEEVPVQDLFPKHLRSTIAQFYLHDIPWVIPLEYRSAHWRASFLERFAMRYCRIRGGTFGVAVWSAWRQIQLRNFGPYHRVSEPLLRFDCVNHELVRSSSSSQSAS